MSPEMRESDAAVVLATFGVEFVKNRGTIQFPWGLFVLEHVVAVYTVPD